MTPTNGTVLTVTGVATMPLAAAVGNAGGAATITATAQVAGTTVSALIGFSVGAVSLPSITMSALTFGVGAAPLSAFGTTSVSVSVFSGGALVTTPQIVAFSSPCASTGQTVLTTSATTISGVATASYHANGCTGTDLVIASVGAVSSSSTITVTAADVGSMQFVSASPTTISLKGTGSAETSRVTFRVVDVGGQPISGKVVTFTLSTTTGGITLTPAAPATATSGTDGLVVTTVNAGTVSTPVRVTASTPGATLGTTLNTQSNVLTITTGIPDQDSFSLSATETNIEGWGYDGILTTLTVRMADHFNNPVPDGTAVNFTAEGGRVVASCVTSGGNCSSTFNSQNPRPSNGRVTVLAYAVGEESFLDRDGDGLASKVNSLSGTTELVDSNGTVSSDMPEAFRDDNENGTRQTSETFIDFNSNGAYDAADGNFNGILCRETAAGGTSSADTCVVNGVNVNKTIHVRNSMVIVFSGSFASINTDATAGLNLNGCGPTQTVRFRIVDLHNNSMPAGTTITFTADNGTIVGPSSIAVSNDTNIYALATDYNYSIGIKGDGTISAGVCTDTTLNGSLTVTVTTPRNNVSYFFVNVAN